MNIKDFFILFPINEPRYLTHEDLTAIMLFTYGIAKRFKIDEVEFTEKQKIKSYKDYCIKEINKKYENLDNEGRLELDKFINLFVMYYSAQHLVD